LKPNHASRGGRYNTSGHKSERSKNASGEQRGKGTRGGMPRREKVFRLEGDTEDKMRIQARGRRPPDPVRPDSLLNLKPPRHSKRRLFREMKQTN